MQHLIILHTNDIHGRVEGLARIATLVAQIRAANPQTSVLFFDCGDVEEPAQRVSNLTKGAGMHRLLSRSGCKAAVIGNGAWLRYGPQVLTEYGKAARYPLLLANLRTPNGELLHGVQATTMIEAGDLRLGLIGVTAEFADAMALFGLSAVPTSPLVQELAVDLRRAGAHAVIVLSHLGLNADRELAPAVAGQVLAILGAHTHDLLPEGEKIGDVWLAQTGEYAQRLGRIDLEYDGRDVVVSSVSVIEVTDDVACLPAVFEEAKGIEAEGERFLYEVIGELAEPLDFALDQECGVANLMADVLRERMKAEVGVTCAGQAFTGPLPAGALRRGTLWDVCSTSANPGVVTLSGEQLRTLVTRGLDREFAQDRPRTLRGQKRGLLHLSGASVVNGELWVQGRPVESERKYRVAGSDWELGPYGGYVPKEWDLHPEYDVPTILREAVEDHLRGRGPVTVTSGRLG